MDSVERKVGSAGTLRASRVTTNGVREEQNSKILANTQQTRYVDSGNGTLTRSRLAGLHLMEQLMSTRSVAALERRDEGNCAARVWRS